MSKETKRAAERTAEYLGEASTYLEAAKKTAGETGDKSLTKKVADLHAETVKVKTDLGQRMEPKQG